ncbi:MAG: polysaccharide deacetylase family protein, partial [Hyphomicrobiales bacterium]
LRDDDAIRETSELKRLAAWCERANAEILLAVIPHLADETLAASAHNTPFLVPCVHGWAHKNHAPANEKKMELGAHRARADVLDELRAARERIEHLFAGHALDVLVPPWNRVDDELVSALPDLGFRGLSTFANQFEDKMVEGFTVANIHVDVIDWKGSRGCRPHADIISDLSREARTRTCVGLLTHHLVHDESVWNFLDEMADFINAHPAAHWISPRSLF